MLSFRNQLLILLIGIVVSAQTVTLVTALVRTSANERHRADGDLEKGVVLAQEQLDSNEKQLANVVSLLGSDYGLKQAFGSRDQKTLASALYNHARRIGADL